MGKITIRDALAVLCALATVLGFVASTVASASGKCVYQGKCTDPLVLGAGDCAYCDHGAGLNERDYCCDCPEASCFCVYSGGPACVGWKRYVGSRSGLPGTCGSCTTSTRYIADGFCENIRNAQGTPCLFCF